ncbi:endo-1,4-beta-xylanase [Rhizocola hellebori]|uniref:endo-1,4-beta-xylanase n=1 Tax=Rhizocola hellebori TaxID=1392758 RepID=UPI001EF1A1FF|nr:endo-1,4-beta-xylanase [Rhizocola hellebori]
MASTLVISSPALADGTLRDHAAERGKFIGAALATGPLSNEAPYSTIARTEFNQVTPENALKWDATEPNDNQYSFSGADQIVNFAVANNQIVHGHTLVWHSQTPGWVQGLNATAMRAAMQDHITTVVGRYANNAAVRSWDVVNEAFEENGSMRQSFWLNTMGQTYIADAFRFARAADPDARLCINDFNVEGINAKSTAMFNLVQSLRAQNVPVDCVGFQGHLAVQFGFPNQVQQNLQRFADLGVQVRITELDVRIPLPADDTELATQNTYYTNMISACNNVTACAGVTIWGFTDKYSWVPDTFSGQGQALLWDTNYVAKPVYNAVHTALDGGTPGDTTPPSTPGTLTASGITSTSVNLAWGASTDNFGVTGYNIYRDGTLLNTVTTTSTTVTGLTASTAYQFFVRARDAAGNLSPQSNTVSVTTAPGTGDTSPPTTPGTLNSSAVTSTSVTLAWGASTDNVGVTGYNVFRNNALLTTVTTTSTTVTGLTPATAYQFFVQARDAAGNVSANSNTVSVTTSPGTGGGCSVAATVQTQWSNGYVVQPITVTNTGTSTISAWTVTFTLPAGHTIVGSWNAAFTISGQTITARNMSYNGTLGPNASTTFGYQASRPNGNTAVPSTYTCS